MVVRPYLVPLLPTFHGMESENPHSHMKEFEEVFNAFNEETDTVDLMRLKLFPFTLKDKAPQTLIIKSSMLYKVLFKHYIPPKTMQITKMTKAVNYYRDNLGRKHKKGGQKVKKKGAGDFAL